MPKRVTTVPYENASSGAAAREEIIKVLKRFGCSAIGFMDNYEEHELILAFQHRGRSIQLKASAKGWAQIFLKGHPYHWRSRYTEPQYKQRALEQGLIAVNSILRDWIKGQVTAVECGILSFEAVFMPYMLTKDGTPLQDRLKEMGVMNQLQIEDANAG